jgi:hypothetical protein
MLGFELDQGEMTWIIREFIKDELNLPHVDPALSR